MIKRTHPIKCMHSLECNCFTANDKKTYKYKIWSKKDDKVLRENYNKMSARAIGELFDRSASAVRRRAMRLGLKKTKKAWLEAVSTEVKKSYEQRRG